MRSAHLSVQQAAAYLAVSTRTIRNYIRRGVTPTSPLMNVKLRATKFGRSWRIAETDLAAFEAALQAAQRDDR